MALGEKSSRILRFLAESAVPGEVLVRAVETYPALYERISTSQAKRFLDSAIRLGDDTLDVLERARQRGFISDATAPEILRGVLTRRVQNPIPAASEEETFRWTENPARPDAGARIVHWLLDNFTFAPAMASAVVMAIPDPSDSLRAQASYEGHEENELPSVDTICLLARRQPLTEEARIRLFSLLGYAASEDFLYNLWRRGAQFDTGHNGAFWSRFPILRNLALVAREDVYKSEMEEQQRHIAGSRWNYTPGVSPLPPGGLVEDDATAERLERLLQEMGWFVRIFQKKYGRETTERTFQVSDNLSIWLACASAYAHSFGNGIHGGTQVYRGQNVHLPAIGEFFTIWRWSYEVTRLKARAKGDVRECSALAYPREVNAHKQPPVVPYGITIRLRPDGSWRQTGGEARRSRLGALPIHWGEFRTGAGVWLEPPE